MTTLKVKVVVKGDVVILENEYGGKAVIPLKNLCQQLKKLGLDPVNYDCKNRNPKHK